MSDAIWRIEKLVPGGAGLARLADGRVGFARGVLPGERVEVLGQIRKKGYVEARDVRVLEPAPARVTPPCPVAERCGGCDFLYAGVEAQRALKAGFLREALTRTGGFEALPPIEIEPSPRPLGYRSRIRLHIDPSGRLGFYARKTHDLIEIESCAVARPEIDGVLETLRAIVREHAGFAAHFAELELRAPPDGKPCVRLVPREPCRLDRAALSSFVDALRAHFDLEIAGVTSGILQRWPLDERLTLLVPPAAFVQVNWELNQRLVRAVVAGAVARGARTFLDLYAGVGNFTLGLAASGLSGVSIESQPEAVTAARRALGEHGFADRVRLLVGDAPAALARLGDDALADLAVLDPPRRGAAALIEPLASARPRFIGYCSCDPVTLARDLRELRARGYALEAVQGFDMFPGTHHVEALAWMRRER